MYIKKEMIERIMIYLLYTMKYAELSRILCNNSKGIHGLLLNEKEKKSKEKCTTSTQIHIYILYNKRKSI